MTPTEIRKTVFLLLAQAMSQASQIIFIALSGLVGQRLAPDPALATLPVALVVVCNALMMFPASKLMDRLGQRGAFLLGSIFGIASGCLSAFGIFQNSFVLFVFGNALLGFANAFAQFYRFAAADAVRDHLKAKALSMVLVAGVGAAFLGPLLVRQTQHIGNTPLMVPFLCISGLGCLAFVFNALNPLENKRSQNKLDGGRPLSWFFKQPKFLLAVLASASSFLIMAMVMTATPLAMKSCGHHSSASTTVIQWHVLGMYVPSFFSGTLLTRFGIHKIMWLGLATLAISAGIALSGKEMIQFLLSLSLLGIGWNFLFVSGSTLLTQVYQDAEKSRVQACHDFFVLGAASLATFSSGGVLQAFGWSTINGISLTLVVFLVLGLWVFKFHLQPARQE